MEISIVELNLDNLPVEYDSFLSEYYSEHEKENYLKRQKWYKKNSEYKIYVAYINNKIAGQACGYKCEAVIHNRAYAWFWGVDTFALRGYRGLGVGKKLQKALHESCLNFSSAWYSPVNGIIKDKCGAVNLFDLSFYYYPVSTFILFYFRSLLCKFIKKDFKYIHGLYPLYINRIKDEDFYVSTNEDIVSEEHICFINRILSKSDFYVKRTKVFLFWKYKINPSLKINQLVLRKGSSLVGIVYFSEVHACAIRGLSLNCVKLLDVFILPEVNVQIVLGYVLEFFSSKKIRIDGIVSMMKIDTKFKFSYYHNPLKSTYRGDKIDNPYLSFIDQDMEQIY